MGIYAVVSGMDGAELVVEIIEEKEEFWHLIGVVVRLAGGSGVVEAGEMFFTWVDDALSSSVDSPVFTDSAPTLKWMVRLEPGGDVPMPCKNSSPLAVSPICIGGLRPNAASHSFNSFCSSSTCSTKVSLSNSNARDWLRSLITCRTPRVCSSSDSLKACPSNLLPLHPFTLLFS